MTQFTLVGGKISPRQSFYDSIDLKRNLHFYDRRRRRRRHRFIALIDESPPFISLAAVV